VSLHERSLAEPAFPNDGGLIDRRLADALGDDAKSADMAAVFMTGADGRKALLTFSSVAALEAWNPVARPVPVWGREAAQAALDEGASALLLDLGADHFTVLELRQ
jgi:hypothetical protein